MTNSNKKNILGSTIKDIRKQKKMTQTDLSKLTGLSQNTISNHELGNRSLDAIDIQKYANAFNLSPDDIFEAYIYRKSIADNIMVVDKKQTYLDNTIDILKKLSTSQRKEVFLFASSILEKKSKEEEKNSVMTIAAHLDDDVSEEKMEEIVKYIDSKKQKDE